MDKEAIIAKFKTSNTPLRKKSKLNDFKSEILTLSAEGYTQAQLIVLLKDLGVETKQANLSRWIKRQRNPKKSSVYTLSEVIQVTPVVSTTNSQAAEVVEKKVKAVKKPVKEKQAAQEASLF